MVTKGVSSSAVALPRNSFQAQAHSSTLEPWRALPLNDMHLSHRVVLIPINMQVPAHSSCRAHRVVRGAKEPSPTLQPRPMQAHPALLNQAVKAHPWATTSPQHRTQKCLRSHTGPRRMWGRSARTKGALHSSRRIGATRSRLGTPPHRRLLHSKLSRAAGRHSRLCRSSHSRAGMHRLYRYSRHSMAGTLAGPHTNGRTTHNSSNCCHSRLSRHNMCSRVGTPRLLCHSGLSRAGMPGGNHRSTHRSPHSPSTSRSTSCSRSHHSSSGCRCHPP